MLFLAITLGFIAENLRESFVERRREITYLENIHQDLQKDLASSDLVIRDGQESRQDMNAMMTLHLKGGITKNLSDFYYYAKNLSLSASFERSDNGFVQLRNSGGLRLIENKEVLVALQEYEAIMKRIQALQELVTQGRQIYRLKANGILNAITTEEMNKNMGADGFRRPSNPLPLFNADPAQINELLGMASNSVRGSEFLADALTRLKSKALELDNIIMHNYGGSFKSRP